MSEEQLKAAEAEATKQESAEEEISEVDLEGVDGGACCPSSDDPSLLCPN